MDGEDVWDEETGSCYGDWRRPDAGPEATPWDVFEQYEAVLEADASFQVPLTAGARAHPLGLEWKLEVRCIAIAFNRACGLLHSLFSDLAPRPADSDGFIFHAVGCSFEVNHDSACVSLHSYCHSTRDNHTNE